uniref:ATP synthase complex subunit 8 n=1 Tax=Danionella mirifica TaxID=487619 RepID=F3Y700_9TELE|nr:ATPase subunit 8 [Danionella mirifica]
MPQLNPSPWFVISLWSWLVLLTVLPMKILKLTKTHTILPHVFKQENDNLIWVW